MVFLQKIVKRNILMFFLLFLVLCGQSMAAQQEDLLQPWYTWQALNSGTVVSLDDFQLNLRSQGDFPAVFNRRLLSIILSETDLLVFEMQTSVKGEGSILWSDYQNPQFGQNRRQTFYLGRPNQWKKYYFNLSPSKNDSSRIDHLLINPFMGQGTAQIRALRFVRGNLYLKTLAAIQEFFGPQGRKIVGYTINTMQNPVLFGENIFYYIYWLLGLVILIFFVMEARTWLTSMRKPLFEDAFVRLGKNIVIAILIFWALLEMSSWYTNWLNLQDDLPLLGKSLDEKRVMVNSGDFYAFIKFCEENIPPQANFDMRIPPVYNDIKASFYLLPRFYAVESDYIIVYDKSVEDEIWNEYEIKHKFRNGAFILKRKGTV